MRQKRGNPCRFFLGFLFFNLTVSEAVKADETAADNHFQKGLFEASLGSGAMFSPFAVNLSRPTVDYTVTEAVLGYMLTAPAGPGILRGNFEVAGSLFGGTIFNGEGTYVTGTTVWLRYNFVPETGRFAPYAQAGMGLTGTDLDRRIESQNFNFNLNLGAGVRYFVARNWSLNLECRYQHISNADMAEHNLGINAIGGLLSVSYFF
jgi:opacity protein-like surface antigen